MTFCAVLPLCLTAQNHKTKEQKFTAPLTEKWDPEPAMVKSNNSQEAVPAPSDAIVLLSPTSGLGAWKQKNSDQIKWKYKDGVLTVTPHTGNIYTKENFGDCQLHLEWSVSTERRSHGQGRANSGVFLQSLYEIQILDSYENRTYANGQAGSIYKQSAPLVNPINKPGEWNSYDIIYHAPTFNKDGSIRDNARVTVLFNGVLVQNNTVIQGTTEYIGLPKQIKHGDAPLMIQDHFIEVRFRNIWIRKL